MAEMDNNQEDLSGYRSTVFAGIDAFRRDPSTENRTYMFRTILEYFNTNMQEGGGEDSDSEESDTDEEEYENAKDDDEVEEDGDGDYEDAEESESSDTDTEDTETEADTESEDTDEMTECYKAVSDCLDDFDSDPSSDNLASLVDAGFEYMRVILFPEDDEEDTDTDEEDDEEAPQAQALQEWLGVGAHIYIEFWYGCFVIFQNVAISAKLQGHLVFWEVVFF